MTRAGAPRSAAIKGSLDYMAADGALSIPVFVYGKSAQIKTGGIDFHMYHDECHGRVNYKNYCSTCDKSIERENIVKLAEVGDGKVQVSKEELDEILSAQEKSIRILGTIPLKNIPAMIQQNVLVFHEVMEVRPFKTGSRSKDRMPLVEKQVRLLFDALDKNQQALYVEVPTRGMKRYGLLFPSGDLHTLRYQEEVREDIEMMYGKGEGYDKANFTALSSFLKGKEVQIPEAPSCAGMLEQVDELLLSKKPIEEDVESPNGGESTIGGIINVKGFQQDLMAEFDRQVTKRKARAK